MRPGDRNFSGKLSHSKTGGRKIMKTINKSRGHNPLLLCV